MCDLEWFSENPFTFWSAIYEESHQGLQINTCNSSWLQDLPEMCARGLRVYI